MQKYVFGYGSLMNPQSLQRTLPGKQIERTAMLLGYQRKFNAVVGEYLYLNIVPVKGSKVKGVLIRVSDKNLSKLKQREVGYKCVEITEQIKESVSGRVFAFVTPDKKCPEMKILQSYINTCLLGISEKDRAKWLKETIILNFIENDTASPKYPPTNSMQNSD